ncbi:DNA-binding transcriptional LysR family regulator [Paenibacillus mucilaginosus]|uniref:LysR family transcriptional regulator n=1 Tax=Paenibacillus mucilaginosus TaxID=61624 RepID=UPI003D21D1F8
MFRQLECFIQICREGSFTKAADVLTVSQPTLSQQIRYLEAQVGTPLFERVGRGVKITAAGEILYEKALSVMKLIEEAKKETDELRHARASRLAIGILPADLHYFMPRLLAFHEGHPGIQLKFVVAEDLPQQLLEGRIDIAITDAPERSQEIHMMHLYKEEQVLAVHADHPWAHRTVISLQELEGLGSALLVSDVKVIKQLPAYNEKIAKCLESTLASNSAIILLHMVLHNVGAAIVPMPLTESFIPQGVKLIRFSEPKPAREIKLMFSKHQFSSPSIQTLVHYLQEITGQE